MKKILLLLILLAGFTYGQVTGKSQSDLTKHGRGGNSTSWIQNVVFVDSGATRVGPFVCDEPPIAVGITRNAVWDSVTATTSDDFHWDSSWTTSSLAYLLGYKRSFNDSARTTITLTDSIDFLPLFIDGTRYAVTADSMQMIGLTPVDMAGSKYFYLEFYDAVGDSLVPQAAPRTMVFLYRKY